MDATAINVNVTVDDFDSILNYPVQSDWTTPDPSQPNFQAGVKASGWFDGTYHKTDVVGASIEYNFTGPAIYIYGASGPTYGLFSLTLDSTNTTLNAYAPKNATTPHLLFSSDKLAYTNHTLVLTNLGSGGNATIGSTFLFDFLKSTIQVGPANSTAPNNTLQETDPTIMYSGIWNNNTSPNFSGGGTMYTNHSGASFSLSFRGSAIYIFGDKKNDHGLYSVTIDSFPTEIHNGISGCGGAYGMTCEQQQPTLAFVGSNLDGSLHNLELVNIGGVNNSFFDLDSIIITTPSSYAPRDLSNTTASSSSSTPSANDSALSASPNILFLLFFVVLSLHILRPRF